MSTETPSQRILKFFNDDHIITPLSMGVEELTHCLAHSIDELLPDCAEKTVGLRKLLEAKDCFVRAATEQQKEK